MHPIIVLLAAVVALAAGIGTALWFNQPIAKIVFGSTVGGFFAGLAALVHFDTVSWWQWFFAVLGGFALVGADAGSQRNDGGEKNN